MTIHKIEEFAKEALEPLEETRKKAMKGDLEANLKVVRAEATLPPPPPLVTSENHFEATA